MLQKTRSFILIPYFVTLIIMIAEIAISFNSVLLPNIKLSFDISDAMAQSTLSIGLFALGFSGLIYGGFSDSLGRKPIFITSTTLFSIASYVCSHTEHTSVFLCARFLQGMGSGAAWIVGNACLKDVYHGVAYRRIMNYVHAIAGITPAVAPLLGSWIAQTLGWRNCFLILSIFSSLTVLLMIRYHQETLEHRTSLDFKTCLNRYYIVIKHPVYLRYLALKASAVMLMFCEISTIPLVFIEHLKISYSEYSQLILMAFIAYIMSTIWSARQTKYPVELLLKIGFSGLIISNITVYLFNHLIALNAFQIQAIKLMSYASWGLIFGNATAQIVSLIPEHSGIASAFMIATEMLLSAGGISLLSVYFNGTIQPLSLFMTLIAFVCLMLLQGSQHLKPTTSR